MRIKQQVNVVGQWHVAIHNSEGEGALLYPVVCFMVVNDEHVPDQSHDAAVIKERVVAFIHTPSDFTDDGALMAATELDDDVFIALVPPGEEVNGPWDDIARERAKAASQVDDRKEEKAKAEKALYRLNGNQRVLLRKLNMEVTRKDGNEFASFGDLLNLARLELIHVWPSDIENPLWATTALGRVVVHLDTEEG